jgi:hypothetical protein
MRHHADRHRPAYAGRDAIGGGQNMRHHGRVARFTAFRSRSSQRSGMSPILSHDDQADGGLTYAKHLADLPLAHPAAVSPASA